MRWSTPHAVSAPPVTLFHGPTPSLVRQLGEWCSRVSLMLREAQTQTFADAFLVAAVCFADAQGRAAGGASAGCTLRRRN